MSEKLKFKLEEGVAIPEYESEGATGFDLAVNKILKVYKGDVEEVEKLSKIQQSFIDRGYLKLRPFERVLFGTGIRAEIPNEYEVQIRPRSGVSLKKGLIIVNSPGTIDSDYIGEWGIIICNNTPFLNTIQMGTKLGQAVIQKKERLLIEVIREFTKKTERGEGAYGSTGS